MAERTITRTISGDATNMQKALTSVGSTAWPNTWKWPQQPTTYWPPATYVYSTPVPQQEYANEVEIEENEHDAIVRFYRKRGGSRSLVKEITIPIGLLAWFRAKA